MSSGSEEINSWLDDSDLGEESRSPSGSPSKKTSTSFSQTEKQEKLVSNDDQLETWLNIYHSESKFRQKFWESLESFEAKLSVVETEKKGFLTPKKKLLQLRQTQIELLKEAYKEGCLTYFTLDRQEFVFYDDRPLLKAVSKLLKAKLVDKKNSSTRNNEPRYGGELNSLISKLRKLHNKESDQQKIPQVTLRKMESSLLKNEPKSTKNNDPALLLEYQREIQRLVSTIKQLEQTLRTTKNALSHAVQQNTRLKQTQIDYKKQITDERDVAIERSKEIAEELDYKASEVVALQKNISVLKDKIRVLERKLNVVGAAAEERLDVLNTEVRKARKRYKRLLKTQRESHKKQLEEVESESEAKFKEKIAVLEKELEKELNREEWEEIKKLKELLREKDAHIRALTSDNKNLTTQVEVLGGLINEDQVLAIQALEEENSALKEKVASGAEGAGTIKRNPRRKLFIEVGDPSTIRSGSGSTTDSEDDRSSEEVSVEL